MSQSPSQPTSQSPSGPLSRAGAILWALAACAALGACDLVLGIPDRTLDPHVVCDGGGCACGDGFADCDGNAANGCEADLSLPATCGACGRNCQNADCVAGACACDADFADCDGDADNGCEASLETDAENCGACGHGCLGGACQGRQCQPVQLGKFTMAEAIQILGGSLYVAGCDAPPLAVLPTSGGPVKPASTVKGGCGDALAIAGDAIFWDEESPNCIENIAKSPLGTDTAATVLVANASVASFAATPTLVYWNDPDVTELNRVSVTGGTVEKVFAGDVESLVVDTTHAYFSDDCALYSVPHDGTTVKTLAPVPANVLAVSGQALYAGVGGESLVSVPITGGSPKVLAPVDDPEGIAVDDTYVYWSDGTAGTVNKVPIAGGPTVVLVTGQAVGSNPIAVDAQAVYFIVNGAVFRVAK